MDSADVVLLTDEDWTDDFDNIKYAHLFWSKLTDEQKEEEVNMLGTGYKDWLASIERIGALGVTAQTSSTIWTPSPAVTITKNSEPAPTASSNITSAPTARRKKISPMRLRTSRPLLAR